MKGNDEFISKIRQTKEELTLPIAFNMLNRCIKDQFLDQEKALAYRMELGNLVWEYLTAELHYEFSPAVYQAMRKILKTEMRWAKERSKDDPELTARVNFFLALTADGTNDAKAYLARITGQQDEEFLAACRLLSQMVEAHEEACGAS